MLSLNEIYHPNISPDGHICSDMLGDGWGPYTMLTTALVGIAALLNEPNVDDALEREVADVYIYEREVYEERARAWTRGFAGPGWLRSEEGLERCLRCVRLCARIVEG